MIYTHVFEPLFTVTLGQVIAEFAFAEPAVGVAFKVPPGREKRIGFNDTWTAAGIPGTGKPRLRLMIDLFTFRLSAVEIEENTRDVNKRQKDRGKSYGCVFDRRKTLRVLRVRYEDDFSYACTDKEKRNNVR